MPTGEPIYEENPENKLSLMMFGAFAEFERAKIRNPVCRPAEADGDCD